MIRDDFLELPYVWLERVAISKNLNDLFISHLHVN